MNIELAGTILSIDQNGNSLLLLVPNQNNGQTVNLFARGGTLNGEAGISGYANDNDGYGVNMLASNGTNKVQIIGLPVTNEIQYKAVVHKFDGKIINLEIIPKDFPDDTTAAAGGVEIGEDYHDNGIKRVRIA